MSTERAPRPYGSREGGRAFAGGALLLALSARSGEARAQYIPGNEIYAAGALVVGVLAADVVFTVNDVETAAHGTAPDRGWGVAETAVAAPESAIIDWEFLWATSNEPYFDAHESRLLLIVPAIWSNALLAHGIWGLAGPDTRPSLLLGGSGAVGANTVFTVSAVRRAASGRLARHDFAIPQLLVTAPETAAWSYAAAVSSSSSERAGLAALAAWSGALFLHGAASLAFGRDGPPGEQKRSEAARVAFGPLVIPARTGRAFGFQLNGAF